MQFHAFRIFIIVCFTMLLSVCSVVASEKPIIGILLNSGDDNSYSIFPWYAIRKNYSEAVIAAGGVPIFIGHNSEAIEDYLAIADGILLTGGDFPTPEEAYTTGIKGNIDKKRFERSYIEFELIRQAYAKDLPLLGICGGMQNMNAAMGGTLYQNLKTSLKTSIQHRQEARDKVQHTIAVEPQTKLFTIFQVHSLQVNSNHHGGIHKVAPPFVINARAPDGVIEGFEAPNKRFFMGVMWHPEFQLSTQEQVLWQSFVKSAANYHQQKVLG